MSRKYAVPQPQSGAKVPRGYPPPPDMTSFNYPPSRESIRTDRSTLAEEPPRSHSRKSKGRSSPRRERKEGFTTQRPTSRGGVPEIPQGMGSIFPLAHTPDNTYVSVVKSDIYQVQMRLEALVRSSTRSSGGDRPPSARTLGKRHAELEAMKTATQDVETVTANISDPTQMKLKLLEHLCGAMLQLEISLLLVTEPNSTRPFEGISSRPGSANSAVAPPSLSRLPSFLACVDRLIEFNGRIDEASSSSFSADGTGVGTAVNDMVEEIEDQVRMLEAELAMRPSSATPTLMEKQGSSIQALIGRLKRAGQSVEIVRERGIRFLQQEVKDSKKTTKEIGDVLDKARREFQAKEKESAKKISASETQIADLQAKLGKAGNGKGGDSKRVQDLEAKVKEFQGAASAIGSAKKKDIDGLAREVSTLKKKLDAEVKRRGEDADKQLRAIQKAEVKSNDETKTIRKQLQSMTTDMNSANTSMKAEEADNVRLSTEIATLKRELEKTREVQTEETKKNKEEAKAFKSRIAGLTEQNKLLEEKASAKDINTSLQKQVRELSEQLSKLTRSFSSLENYYKDSQKDKEADNKQLSIDLVSMREEVKKTKFAMEELESQKDEQIKQLNKTIHQSVKGSNETDVVREVMAAEMRMMQTGFNTKLSKIEQEKSSMSMAHFKQRRVVQAQLESTRKTDSNIINALKLQIEGLKRKA